MPYCQKCGSSVRIGATCCENCDTELNSSIRVVQDEQLKQATKPSPYSKETCPYCNGSGQIAESLNIDTLTTCSVCEGHGYNLIPSNYEKCIFCEGTGSKHFGYGTFNSRRPDPACKGTGWVSMCK